MDSLAGQTAVISGASSGIGAAVAVRLAACGVGIFLVGRDAQRLEGVAGRVRAQGADVHIVRADLTQGEDLDRLQSTVEETVGAVEILIHSAGTIATGRVEDMPEGLFLDQLKINTIAPYALTRRLLPGLRQRRGQIVFINSLAGLNTHSGLAQYSATKFALRAVADALRAELGDDGVRVMSIYPGKTDTPMQQSLYETAGKDYPRAQLVPPEAVAESVVTALRTPRTAEIIDLTIRHANKV